jgi:hypothetical protein
VDIIVNIQDTNTAPKCLDPPIYRRYKNTSSDALQQVDDLALRCSDTDRTTKYAKISYELETAGVGKEY